MSLNFIALFPGQGSQKVGMGKELFEKSELAKRRFAEADDVLGFKLSTLCFEGPIEKLTATEVAQPAILTTSVICYEIAQEMTGNKLRPRAAAGHSLGEYSALVAAGVLSFAEAVKAVNARGKFMQEAVPAGAGKMYAVLGKEVSELEAALNTFLESNKTGIVSIANINAPGQIVIAGDAATTTAFVASQAGTKCIELTVSAPFHCGLMKPAEEKLTPVLEALHFKDAQFPIYANVSAQATSKADIIKSNLLQQVCGKVRWVECMQNALKEVETDTVIEFGTGTVLTGLMKRIQASTTRENFQSLESITEYSSKFNTL